MCLCRCVIYADNAGTLLVYTDESMQITQVHTQMKHVFAHNRRICADATRNTQFAGRGGGLGSRTIFKKFNEPNAPS